MAVEIETAPKASGTKVRVWRLLALAGAAPAMASVAGYFGGAGWPLDLCSHFRVQYFVAMGILALLMLMWRGRKMRLLAGGFAALAMVNLAVIVPMYFGRPARGIAKELPIRAMLLNVNQSQGNPQRVVQVIGQINPDIVVLEEISGDWISELAPVLSAYPNRHSEPRDDNFGIIVLSKLPILRSQTLYLGNAGLPSVLAEIQTPQGRCSILATHPLPPGGGRYSQLRNEQLSAVAAYARQAPRPLLLMGDLNTTPWSSHFAGLVRESGLRDSGRGFGVQPSWPAGNVFLRIPIDHCLHSADIKIVERRIGPDSGSDHFPLIVDFRITALKPN